jgi:hypothetical protein
MKHIFLFLVAAFGLFSMQSCVEDEPEQPTTKSTATIRFDARWQGSPFVMQQVYNDAFGNRIRSDKFLNYFSLITLVAEDGSEVLVRDFMLAELEFRVITTRIKILRNTQVQVR